MKRTPLKRGKPLRKASPSKNFGARPVYDIENGEYHASKAEHQRWQMLKLLERVGDISGLEHQPQVVLIEKSGKAPAIKWRLDSSYIEDGRRVWEDIKPRPFTPRENLLMALWKHYGPGLLRITDNAQGKVRKTVMPKEGQ